MNHPIILFFKYWYITFPLLFILLSLYNKGDNEASKQEQSVSPQLDSLPNTKKKKAKSFTEEAEKLFDMQAIWYGSLVEQIPYESQSEEKLEFGYEIIERGKKLSEVVRNDNKHSWSKMDKLAFLTLLDSRNKSFEYEVLFRDQEKFGFPKMLQFVSPHLHTIHSNVLANNITIEDELKSREVHKELLAEHEGCYNLYEDVIRNMISIHLNSESYNVPIEEIEYFMNAYTTFQEQAIKHLKNDEVREYQVLCRLLDAGRGKFEQRDFWEQF
ncbi:hypothetical protein HPA99_05975 [Streptococcus suis]|nr:hypothetical protein [Streptococcus suis]